MLRRKTVVDAIVIWCVVWGGYVHSGRVNTEVVGRGKKKLNGEHALMI
jgi:hypothetical protein